MKNKSSIPEYLKIKYCHAQIPSSDNIHSSIDIELFPNSRRGEFPHEILFFYHAIILFFMFPNSKTVECWKNCTELIFLMKFIVNTPSVNELQIF